jgi:hypothetical protein
MIPRPKVAEKGLRRTLPDEDFPSAAPPRHTVVLSSQRVCISRNRMLDKATKIPVILLRRTKCFKDNRLS